MTHPTPTRRDQHCRRFEDQGLYYRPSWKMVGGRRSIVILLASISIVAASFASLTNAPCFRHMGISNQTHPWAHMPTQHGYDDYLGLPYTNMHFCTSVWKKILEGCSQVREKSRIHFPSSLTTISADLPVEMRQGDRYHSVCLWPIIRSSRSRFTITT